MVGREDLFEESMQLGHSAAWDQDWERAISFYRKAVAEFPEDADALTSLGLALLETGREREALSVYRQASKAAPSDPVPYEKCAEIFEQLQQTEAAIEQREAAADRYMRRRDAEKALENWVHIGRMSPTNLTARSRLALTNERLGRRRQAIHEYISIASIFQHSERPDRAREAIQRALNLVPGDPEAAKAMRALQEGSTLPPAAPPIGASKPLRMSQLKAYLGGSPDEGLISDNGDAPEVDEGVELSDPEVAAKETAIGMMAGLLFDEPGEPDLEPEEVDLDSLAKGISRAKGEAVGQPAMFRYLGQAIDSMTHDRLEEASRELQRAFDSGLDHPAVHYGLGYLYRELGQHEEAQSHYLEAVGHQELALGANLALGRINRERGDQSEAARFLLQALRIADELSVGKARSSQLGELYDSIQASQSEGDEQALSKIVESTLEFLSGPEWLSRIRSAREQLEGQSDERTVVPIAEMLAATGSDHVIHAMGRIDDLATQGLLSAAMEEAMLALQYAPTYLGLHRRMAQIMIQSGDTEAGVSKLKTIARTHKVRGETNEAATVYERILKYNPVDTGARQQLIRLLNQQGRTEEAVDQYIQLSEIFRQMAQIDQARESLARAFERAERDGAAPEHLLRILTEMGDMDVSRLDWRRALDVYMQVLRLDPGNESAMAQVIDLNLRLGQEARAAEALDGYLEHLVENGRASDALEFLEEFVREYPGKQILHARLAEAYRAAGRKADAIAQYDALGEIQLDSGNVEQAIETIETIIGLDPPDAEGYQELLRNLRSNA